MLRIRGIDWENSERRARDVADEDCTENFTEGILISKWYTPFFNKVIQTWDALYCTFKEEPRRCIERSLREVIPWGGKTGDWWAKVKTPTRSKRKPGYPYRKFWRKPPAPVIKCCVCPPSRKGVSVKT